MKKIIALFAFLSLTLLVSCSGNGPEGVAKKFLVATNEGDFETAKEYADESTSKLLGMVAGMMSEEDKKKEKEKDVKVIIVKSEEKEDTAVVTYKLEEDGKTSEEKTLDLKKIDGDWKVSMNKEDAKKEGSPGA